jgi:hypothetical protein
MDLNVKTPNDKIFDKVSLDLLRHLRKEVQALIEHDSNNWEEILDLDTSEAKRRKGKVDAIAERYLTQIGAVNIAQYDMLRDLVSDQYAINPLEEVEVSYPDEDHWPPGWPNPYNNAEMERWTSDPVAMAVLNQPLTKKERKKQTRIVSQTPTPREGY